MTKLEVRQTLILSRSPLPMHNLCDLTKLFKNPSTNKRVVSDRTKHYVCHKHIKTQLGSRNIMTGVGCWGEEHGIYCGASLFLKNKDRVQVNIL